MATCDELARQVQELENLLRKTSNEEKRQEILDQISDLNTQQQNQGCFGPPKVVSTLTGRAGVFNDGAHGEVDMDVNITVEFLDQNSIDFFSQFTVTAIYIDDTGLPKGNISDVKIWQLDFSGGSFEASTGEMQCDLTLRFDFVGAPIDHTTGVYHLTSKNTGTSLGGYGISGTPHPVDVNGAITLLGDAQLSDVAAGFIHLSTFLLTGVLSPWPPVPASAATPSS